MKYQPGTIKLTWFNKKDYKTLLSKMFRPSSLQEAIRQGEALDGKYMIFELIETEKNEYKWKLLPYGESVAFERGMEYRNSLAFKLIGITIIAFSLYGMKKYIEN